MMTGSDIWNEVSKMDFENRILTCALVMYQHFEEDNCRKGALIVSSTLFEAYKKLKEDENGH